MLFTAVPVMARAQSVFRPVTRLRNNPAMPRACLEGYDSNSSSRIQSRNSDAVPKYGQHDYDSNATASESEDDCIGAKKIDRQFKCDYGQGDSLYS